jgi:hypothetical protein
MAFSTRATAPALRLARRSLSAAATRPSAKILVVDGYAIEGREELASANATPAGELYAKMLRRHVPAHVDLDIEICFPSDSDGLAPGSAAASAEGLADTYSQIILTTPFAAATHTLPPTLPPERPFESLCG